MTRRLLAAATTLVALTGCTVTTGGRAAVADPDGGEIVVLATYPVVDGARLGEPVAAAVTGDAADLRDDREAHEDAWRLWVDIAPEPWESAVRQLRIVTDGPEGDLAGVVRLDGDDWILEFDAADLVPRDELEHTLVHELAHLISLAPGQIVAAEPPFDLLVDAADACGPAPGVEEGCLAPAGYLGRFIERFWTTADLAVADEIAWSDDPDAVAAEVYAAAPGRFVTEYAAWHPEEDFAESWVAYVLLDWRSRDRELPWVQKAAFFDAYPELVAARDEIWSSLDLD